MTDACLNIIRFSHVERDVVEADRFRKCHPAPKGSGQSSPTCLNSETPRVPEEILITFLKRGGMCVTTSCDQSSE